MNTILSAKMNGYQIQSFGNNIIFQQPDFDLKDLVSKQ